jgi:hypothetical protein
MSTQVRYVTDDEGERVGVLLHMDLYQRLTGEANADPEPLPGLDRTALQALAEGMLAPAAQTRLDALLASNVESHLSEDESAELDYLLEQVDQLTILKTRARYTLERELALL